MKRLQRAVNNKDKDNMQAFKGDFEKNKKGLELLVKEIKDKED
jgi:ribosomal protein S17E